MKKIALLLAATLFAVTFTSCKKTKPYNPKEKISKIYVDKGQGKSLSEVWNWDGKRLKAIEHHYTLEDYVLQYYTEVFDYNKKGQVIKVQSEEYGAYTDYIYDKHDRLYQTRTFENGINIANYTFEYDDNELSEIVLVLNDSKSAAAKSIENPLRYVLPELSSMMTDKILNNASAERGSRFEFDIDWIGQNISEIEMEYGNYTEKYYFKYDNKSNPFRNLFGLEILEGLETESFASKNNVVEVTFVELYMGFSSSETENIYYTYDGKFPVTKSYSNIIEYYEYE